LFLGIILSFFGFVLSEVLTKTIYISLEVLRGSSITEGRGNFIRVFISKSLISLRMGKRKEMQPAF
jgi:hypothetical protein